MARTNQYFSDRVICLLEKKKKKDSMKIFAYLVHVAMFIFQPST